MSDGSLLARLKAEHKALGERRTIDLPFPDLSLVGRFKAVGRDTIVELHDRAEKAEGARAGMDFDADLLINTCEGIFEPDGENLTPLNTLLEEWGDEPVTFKDRRIADAVGADLPANYTTRDIVYAVFRVHEPDTGNDLRFGQFAKRLWNWIRDGNTEADRDF